MTSTPLAAQGRRPKPPPRPVEVVAVKRLGPRLTSVTFGGESLRGFPQPQPTAHIKIQLPEASGELLAPRVNADGSADWPNGFPTMRTYTPFRFDSDSNTLEVWMFDHGYGPAGNWSAKAKVGDKAAIRGPGGRFQVDPSIQRYWIGGDESALPAIVMLMRDLPTTATLDVHVEVDTFNDITGLPPLPEHAGISITWHDRPGDEFGYQIERALHADALAAGTHVWVAGEASSIRRVRGHLLDAGFDRSSFTTRGYWRLGENNHPDGDYGDD